MLEEALTYARENRETFVSQLGDWLRIPSISTLPEHRDDLRRAAEFAADKLREIGFTKVDIDASRSHPILYAESMDFEVPTILLYGHFDVQPVDPLETWTRPPFEPVIEGENLYARGASDDSRPGYARLADPGHHVWRAWQPVCGDRSNRANSRPAIGHLRRRSGQSPQRAGTDSGAIAGRRDAQSAHPGFL